MKFFSFEKQSRAAQAFLKTQYLCKGKTKDRVGSEAFIQRINI